MFVADYQVLNGIVCDYTSPSYKPENGIWKLYFAHSNQFESHHMLPFEAEDAHIIILSPGERIHDIRASLDANEFVRIHIRLVTADYNERDFEFKCDPQDAKLAAA